MAKMTNDIFLKTIQDIFLQISEDLKSQMIASRVFEMDGEIASPVMTVIYNHVGTEEEEVMADYTVIAGGEDESVAYFESFLTLTDELPKDNLSALYEAISKLNFFLPYGSFAVDLGEEILGFKFGMPVSTEISKEEINEDISMLMTGGFMQADRYMFPLMQIAEGRMSVEEFMELLTEEK